MLQSQMEELAPAPWPQEHLDYPLPPCRSLVQPTQDSRAPPPVTQGQFVSLSLGFLLCKIMGVLAPVMKPITFGIAPSTY